MLGGLNREKEGTQSNPQLFPSSSAKTSLKGVEGGSEGGGRERESVCEREERG